MENTMGYQELLTAIKAAFEKLVEIITNLLDNFNFGPNYEHTDRWTDKYPFED